MSNLSNGEKKENKKTNSFFLFICYFCVFKFKVYFTSKNPLTEKNLSYGSDWVNVRYW